MNFDWNNLASNLQENAFKEKKSFKSEVDTRFWRLSTDEDGNGGAIIRFLIDPNEVPFVSLIRINAQTGKKKDRFVTEWSPASIGLPCPFNEKFTELWNAGEKETAKMLKRGNRFITNIKVMKDPANPDNEGKIFLYDMSSAMMDQIKGVMVQTEAMKALEEEPVAVFNPLEGQNFLIKVKKGENGIPTYSESKFQDKITSIYESEEAAVADIKENAYELKEFLNPTFFKSYEELTTKLKWFLRLDETPAEDAQEAPETPAQDAPVEKPAEQNQESAKPAEPTPEEKPAASKVDEDLDDLLAGLDD